MPLFKYENEEFVQWNGEPIEGVSYPFNIENMWSYESLASVGLYRPQEPLPVPEGFKIVSTKPGWAEDGYVRYIHELEEIEISHSSINQECMRRIEMGFLFNGKKFDNDPISNRRIARAGTLAAIAKMTGALPGNFYWHYPSTVWNLSEQDKLDLGLEPFQWIVQDNSIMELDADQVIELGKTAALWEQSHVFAARQLKNSTPIPRDYRDDSYWP